MNVTEFMERHYLHFNAREMVAAAKSYQTFINDGGKMLVSLAGAMSTAELGRSLAEMIRQDKVHAISCTAANLEEDVFNLVAHDDYRVTPNYRDLTPEDELALRDEGYNRVTDTCIPETVLRHLEGEFVSICQGLAEEKTALTSAEIFMSMFERKVLDEHFHIPKEDSWLYAAWEKKIPVYSPGFEDSTLGNIFAANVLMKKIPTHNVVRTGTEQMERLANWYIENQKTSEMGFFQIGGGIAGDFAICVVPMLIQDLQMDVKLWRYFAQISDSTTSYGSYSGAVPNEKITWYKLSPDSEKFKIDSDASIVAPLVFAYVLGW